MATLLPADVHEQRFVIWDADWQMYEQIRTALGERHVSVTYDRGRLEITSPSALHEKLSRLFHVLVVALADEFDVEVESVGSVTMERQDLARAVEPDEGFYIEHVADIDVRDDLDLTVTPPPDLVVEIDITRSSLDRLQIYAALGVPEVWRYDNRALICQVLVTGGCYVASDNSRSFPKLPIAEFGRFLQGWPTMRENTFVKAFRGWLRERA